VLEQLTIVIITYERYPFLKRLMQFYDDYQLEAQILVLDSSSENPDDRELKTLFSRDNVTWKKYDSSIFFANKISEGCKHIITEYAVLCADDDFLIPSALTECVDYLKNNKDYASAHGLYFNHTNAEDAYRKGFSIGPLDRNGRSSEQESAEERLNAYLSGKTGYYPMYAVHSKVLFQRIWTETNHFVSDWGLSELFPCALSFIYGKMRVLPVFYSSREPNNYIWSDENRIREMYSDEKLKLASEGLGKHLSIIDKTDAEHSLSVGIHALNRYLCRYEKKIQSRNNKSVTIWSRLRNNIGLRTRLQKIFLNGCHSSVYPRYIGDFLRLQKAVILNKLSVEALNKSREQYTSQGSH
jgi:glycosyltransferase domain-containing protein